MWHEALLNSNEQMIPLMRHHGEFLQGLSMSVGNPFFSSLYFESKVDFICGSLVIAEMHIIDKFAFESYFSKGNDDSHPTSYFIISFFIRKQLNLTTTRVGLHGHVTCGV